jgi:hypothetical protein
MDTLGIKPNKRLTSVLASVNEWVVNKWAPNVLLLPIVRSGQLWQH